MFQRQNSMFAKLIMSIPHSRAARNIRKVGGKMFTLQHLTLKIVQKHKKTHHMAVFGSDR